MPDERKWRYWHSDIRVITYLGQCFGPVRGFPRQRCRIEVFYIKLLRRDSPHESQDVGCRCASVEFGKEVCHQLRSVVWVTISKEEYVGICSWPQTIHVLLVSKMCRISSLQPRLLWLNFIYLILSYSHFILFYLLFTLSEFCITFLWYSQPQFFISWHRCTSFREIFMVVQCVLKYIAQGSVMKKRNKGNWPQWNVEVTVIIN